MNLFFISSIINAVTSLLMSLAIFTTAGRKQPINRLWAVTTFLLGLWSSGLAGVVKADNMVVALWWQYLLDASAILIPVSFFLFTIYFLNLQETYKRATQLSWVAAALLCALSFTKFFKLGVAPKFNFQYWIEPGPLYPAFPIIFALFVSFSLVLLMKERERTNNAVLKMQINYVLAAQIFGFGGGITNFFPQLLNIYPIGNYFIFFYIVFISYAIFKHNLFNLKVIATEIFLYAIWMFLVTRILVATTLVDRFVESFLLAVVVVFGILLIRSVRKEVEQRLELEGLTRKLQNTNKKLKALDVARQEFISIASHQLRTPPATIKWYLASILAGDFGPLSKALREALAKTEGTNNGLISLIEDLLNVSRIERGKLEFFFEPAQAEDLVQSAYDQLVPIAREKGLEFTYKKPGRPLPTITLDKEKLKQVINNLMDNAIKYTTKGFVHVEADANEKYISIRVSDSGKGVTESDKKEIFQKYKRGDNAHHHSMGLGLGLYVARIVIQEHNGKIWVESEGENKGSTFVVTLPINNKLKPTSLVDLTAVNP